MLSIEHSTNYMTSAVLNPIATGLEVDEFSLEKTFMQLSRIVDTMLAPIRGLLRTIDLLQSWRLPGVRAVRCYVVSCYDTNGKTWDAQVISRRFSF